MYSDSTPYGHYDFSEDGNRDYEDCSEPVEGESPEDVLKKYWGYDEFRPLQRDIIESSLSGRDTIALLPTGGGKSITFQVPALMSEGMTIVISPLISLMADQIANLKRCGVPAVALFMGLTQSQARYALERCHQGKVKLLYIAPERLSSERFLSQLRLWNVSRIVVDEAHCISQWGYDFRPAYLKISRIREIFPDAPVLALTASAPPEVVADIADKLEMRKPAVFSKSFGRPNISFMVRHCENKFEQMLHILSKTQGSSIVYVRSRRKTLELSQYLASEGISAAAYHAGLSAEKKEAAQDAWNMGDVRVIVATTAFGMGIDKPDVRLVIHYDMPSTLEEYYQEAGRAGRDGNQSFAVLLTTAQDKAVFARRLANAFPPLDFVRHIYDEICRYLDIPMGEGFQYLSEFEPSDMCRKYQLELKKVIGSINILQQAQYLEFSPDVTMQSRVHINLRRHELYALNLSAEEESLMDALLRSYPGLFTDDVFVSESRLAYITQLSQQRIYELLTSLRRQHILNFVPRKDSSYIYFLTNRYPGDRLIIEPEVYDLRKTRMKQRLDAMKDFAFNDDECRVRRMLRYFGQDSDDCGTCDVCRSRRATRRFDCDEAQGLLEQWFEKTECVDLRWFYNVYPLYHDDVRLFLNNLAADKRYQLEGIFLRKRR